LSALRREAQEEVGIELDLSYRSRYLGGWQRSRCVDKLINNHFLVISVRAQAESFAVDGNEIKDARWFEKDQLLRHWEAAGQQGTENYRLDIPNLPDPYGRTMVSSWMINCLHTLETGGGMFCTERARSRASIEGEVDMHVTAREPLC